MPQSAPASGLAADGPSRIAFVALIAGALAIAFSPIFVRLSPLEPTATAVWRVALAFPVFWIWQQVDVGRGATARRPSTWRDVLRLSAAGFFFAGDLAFWHWSIRYTSVANATLLSNAAPIFVTLASWLIFGERFSRLFLVGLAVAMAGAVILMGNSLTIGRRDPLWRRLGRDHGHVLRAPISSQSAD